ncbi:hypothetical protein ACFFGT_17465 [Mucilaginibacter angelicae]|uniref:Uncharacterized protein n=1 Tax=Mucilaginibacter angelicae TaxID=869718 RepID=A0ABV6L9C4_9SPHI
MNLDNIFPLIVPRSYYTEGAWELPHQQFNNKEFLLTWVFFNSPGAMTYINKNEFSELNENNNGWQQKAFENLRHSITNKENFFTHEGTMRDGKGKKFLVFMHSDGIGSSRILLSHELSKAFPEGYYVAFPDRSCGLVMSSAVSGDELKEIKQLINNMYKNATTAMSGQLYTSGNFLLPAEWLLPMDEDFSNTLIDKARKAIGV